MSTDHDPYRIDAEFYDAWNTRTDDVEAWVSLAEASGGPVLEVGCGTGRITVPMARTGVAVTGLDPSQAMLARARERAARAGVEVELVQAGATAASESAAAPFMLVLLPADAMLYCEDAAEQERWLDACRQALDADGLLAVDLPGPAAWLDPDSAGQALHVHGGPFEDGRLDVWQIREDSLAEQRRHLTVIYEVTRGDRTVVRSYSEHDLRYVFRYEAELLLRQAGFSIVGLHGDYTFAPMDDESERMIFLARPEA